MGVSEKRRRAAWAMSLGALAYTGCVSELSLEGRACPCTSGYVCCEGICQRSCGTEPEGGSSGSFGSGGASGSHATGGAGAAGGASGSHAAGGAGAAGKASGGTAGAGRAGETTTGGAANATGGDSPSAGESAGENGGTGGENGGGSGATGADGGAGDGGPVAWHLVGDDSLASIFIIGELFDFELGPAGGAYLAFRGCVSCDNPPETTVVPTVLSLSGDEWTPLPTTGLVATDSEPRLVVMSDGALRLLNDGIVRTFDGSSWSSTGDSLPGEPTFDANLTLASPGGTYVTLFDSANGELRVVEDGSGSWQDAGNPFPGDALRSRLSSGGGAACLTYTVALAPVDEHVSVRCFYGVDWYVAGALAGDSAEILTLGSGHAVVAVLPTTLTNTPVRELDAGTWSDLAPLPTWVLPSLALASDGVLYAAFLRDWTYVNVVRWEEDAWVDVPYPFGETPYAASSEPALRIRDSGGRSSPHVAFRSGQHLRVMAYD